MKHVVTGLLMLAVTGVLVPSPAEANRDAVMNQAKDGAPEGSGDGKGPKKRLSDARIRQILIDESIAAYSGNCPCPYSTMRNGRSCGRRSAYSRPGGEAPLCYPKDVTAEMVQAYRDTNGDA